MIKPWHFSHISITYAYNELKLAGHIETWMQVSKQRILSINLTYFFIKLKKNQISTLDATAEKSRIFGLLN